MGAHQTMPGIAGPTIGTRHPGWRALAAATAVALAAASLALLSAPAGAAMPGKAAASGTITVQNPGVTVLKKRAATFSTAKTGQKINVGDTVQTDATGLAELAFPDGSLTRLDTDTVFTLKKLVNETGNRQVEGTVSAGQTWNRVQKLSESDTFEQKGNGATAAVLGTAFVTKCSLPTGVAFKVVKTKRALKKLQKSSTCQFTLIDGKLQLSAQGRTVGVTRGQSVSVNDTGAAGAALTVPPDILFANQWILRNLDADTKAGKAEAAGQPTVDDLKQARIEGSWPVALTVAANNGFRDLAGTVNRTYTFAGSCTGSTCSVSLTRETGNGAQTTALSYANGVYTGSFPDMGTQDCVLDDGKVVVANGLKNSGTVTFSPGAATPQNGLWRATALSGTVTETATPTSNNAACVAANATFTMSASR